VLDLRSFDFAGGQIHGAVNITHNMILDPLELDSVIDRFTSAAAVVFHCMLSIHRAPLCAKLYKKRLLELGMQQKVQILEGGFSRWRQLFSTNEALLDKFGTDDEAHFAEQQLELSRLFGEKVTSL